MAQFTSSRSQGITVLSANPIISQLSCANPGEICSASVPIADRCCDGGEGGNTRCRYTNVDNRGIMVGVCCVGHGKSGCLSSSDCCQENEVCNNGICQYDMGTFIESESPKSPEISSIFAAKGMANPNYAGNDHPGQSTDIAMYVVAMFLGIFFMACLIFNIRKFVCSRGGRWRQRAKLTQTKKLNIASNSNLTKDVDFSDVDISDLDDANVGMNDIEEADDDREALKNDRS